MKITKLVSSYFLKGMAWLFSSWQLLGWILFNPAAWRNYLKSIDSSLEPDCTLWDLWGHWRKPQAQALRLCYILLPVMMAILVGITRLNLYDTAIDESVNVTCQSLRDEETRKQFFDQDQKTEDFVKNFVEVCSYPEGDCSTGVPVQSKEERKSVTVWVAIAYSWVTSCAALLGGFLGSVAFGLVTANVASFLLGISMGLPWPFLNLIGILVGFIAVGIGTSTISTMFREVSLKKRINYFGVILIVTFIVIPLIVYLMKGNYISLLLLVAIFMYIYGVRNALIILTVFLSILGVFQQDIFEINSFNAIAHFMPDKHYSATASIITGLFLMLVVFTMYGISYGIGKKLLDTWNASIIGAVPSLMVFVLHHYQFIHVEVLEVFLGGNLQEKFLSNEWKYPYEIIRDYYLFIMLFVVLLSYHNYILRYLIESTIGTLLYHADKRRYNNPDSPPKIHYLLWHPAFHDKTQVLPFYELEDYLILIGRHHQEIQTYLLQLNETPQANVAKDVLFFLEIIKLAQLKTVDEIAKSSISTIISDDRLEILGEISEELSFILEYSNSGYVVRALEKIQKRLARLEKYALSQDDKLRNYTLQVVKQWKSVIENDKNIRKWVARRRITNPYIPSRPLHPEDGALFKGRQKVRDAIAAFIESQEATLTLYGKKEIGKTSLLLNLQRLMGKSDIRAFFYIDFQRGGINTDDDTFWKNIAEEIKSSLRMSRKWKSRPELLSIPQDNFQAWFNQLMEQLYTHGIEKVILCFDEIGVLFRNFETGSLDENILETFRAITQRFVRFPEVKFIFAYPSAIFDIPSSYRLFNTRMHLSYQFDNEQEARELIEHPISGFELTYEPAVVDKILQLTGKHPRLIQRICHELVEYKNSQDQHDQATLADLDNILPKAKQGVEGLFCAYFDYLKTDEQTLFKFIAAHPAGVSNSQLSQPWPSATQLDNLLSRLIELELIVEQSSQSNDPIYQVTIEMLGEWVRAISK